MDILGSLKRVLRSNMPRSERKEWQHRLHRKAIGESRFHGGFTFEQVEHIAVLAYEGIIPDGDYSDDECSLWSALRREFHHYA